MRPWLSNTVINFMDQNVSKEHSMFEWGSGSSTVYFAPKVGKIISIENHNDWFKKVTQMLSDNKIKNVELVLVPPDSGKCNKVLDPSKYASDSKLFKHRIFKTYAQVIDKYDMKFDWVVVDGRSRNSCLQHAMKKVKPGGYIMLDDSERNRYNPGKKLFGSDEWEIKPLPGKGSGTTHFWKKK